MPDFIFRIQTNRTMLDSDDGQTVDLHYLTKIGGCTSDWKSHSRFWELRVDEVLKVLDGPSSEFAVLLEKNIGKRVVDTNCTLPAWCVAWLMTLGPKIGFNDVVSEHTQELRAVSGFTQKEPVCKVLELWRTGIVTRLKSLSKEARIRLAVPYACDEVQLILPIAGSLFLDIGAL